MRRFLEAFTRNADGSWTCTVAATLHGPTGPIQVAPGNTFAPGTVVRGVEVAKLLDARITGRAWQDSVLQQPQP
jgi:hypothetical protein